jgi:hypothetical protein
MVCGWRESLTTPLAVFRGSKNGHLGRVLFAIFVASSSVVFAAHEDCIGPFDGKQPSSEQIARALKEYRLWLKVPKKQRNDNDPPRRTSAGRICGA